MKPRPKHCRKFLREHKGKGKICKIFCGVAKRVEGCKKIKEYCDVCGAYNNGFEAGYTENIKTVKKCQVLTCSKVAARIVCQDEFLFNVCANHSKGFDWREIKEEDLK